MRQLNGLIGAQPIPAGVYAEQRSYRFREFMGIPLRIVRAGLVGVANRHALDVRFLQEVEHDAQTLRAHTDEGDVDFIAGRDVARAAQNVPGNNGQGQGGAGALLEELAAAEGRDGFCISGLRRFHFRTTARISLAGVIWKMRGKNAAVYDFTVTLAFIESNGGVYLLTHMI